MAETERAPFGTWRSPITTAMVVADSIRFLDLQFDHEDIYWTEMRPQEGGRYVLVRRLADGQLEDVTESPFNVRTRVHEYGGGAFLADDGTIVFANFQDQLLYRQRMATVPTKITQPGYRYADGDLDKERQRMVWVREDHTRSADEPVNTIVAIGFEDDAEDLVLISGHDFYSTPRISPDGRELTWLAWNHPQMPWTSTELWRGEFAEDGSVENPRHIAGGGNESIFEPAWAPDGELTFVSDLSGWWNLYAWRKGHAEPLAPMAAEFGRPQWMFNSPTYGFADGDQLACLFCQNGEWNLAIIDRNTGSMRVFDIPYTWLSSIHAQGRFAIMMAGGPQTPTELIRVALDSGEVEVLRRSSTVEVAPHLVSTPEAIDYPSGDGRRSFGFFYRPRNDAFNGLENERPPLIVFSHGGPTSATNSVLDLEIQYWTSRGFAVLDVNYGGSTGYGRAYRQLLDGRWGVVDVEDCVNGALHLAERGEVDGKRLLIRGGSAGGYTTLAVLTFRDEFAGGTSYYGVSDLEALAMETHKFESRYLDGLIGPYPARRDLYRARSPIHHVDQLSSPILFLQGLEDKIVLPNQAEMMVEALRQKGIPTAYVAFAGEQHGFRREENIIRSLEAEHYFYARVLGLPWTESSKPIEIENLPA